MSSDHTVTPASAPKPVLADAATSSHQYASCVRIAASYVTQHLGGAEMAIVLGSGLMDFVDKFSQSPPPKSLSYASVPYMPGTNVPGHSGKIYVGDLQTKGGLSKVMCFAGRVHAYEGWNPTEFNFIVRLAHACGVKVLLLTNSAGGALKGMNEGSIMMIEDHLRFSGINPLKDVCDDPRFGPKHCTSSFAYSKRIQGIVREAAKKLEMDVLAGTYCWTSGPSYETPSEVRAGQILSVNSLGGSFGMSTVPEVLAAHNLGMEVFAVSLCTNLAAGLGDKELTHGDVKTVAEAAGPRFQNLLLETFANLDVPAEVMKHVVPVDMEASNPATWQQLAQVPSSALYAPSGWTPSLREIQESAERIGALNATAGLASCVLFFGGRGQQAAASHFLAGLTNVKLVPIRELCSIFRTKPDMLSSFARQAFLALGSAPAGGVNKRVAVVFSPDGNGVVGFSSAEASWFVQVMYALGVSTVLASAVGVDTAARTIGGGVGSESKQVLLIEDVLDRQIDPLPLPIIGQALQSPLSAPRSQTPVFDISLLKHAAESLTSSLHSSHGTVKRGAFLSFQGPMLPTEAELNLTFHAGAVAAGISNMAFAETAKDLGMRVLVTASLVPKVQDIPAQAHGHIETEKDSPMNVGVAKAFLHLLAHSPEVAHVARASVGAGVAIEDAAGFAPVSLQSHQEPYEWVRAASAWIVRELSGKHVKSFVFVEGMLNSVFAEGEFKIEQEWPLTEVPHFMEYAGVAGAKSGPFYPYHPHAALSWSLQVVLLPNGERLLVCLNKRDRTGRLPMFLGLNFMIRVAKYLEEIGATNVLIVSPVASCDASIAAGSLVVLQDHINFTGLNPLFGENTPEYGPRFNDMSQVYKPLGIACFTAQPGAGEQLKSTVLLQVPNPSTSSVAEAALARSMHASTIVSGFVPLTTLCKHQDTFVSALGYVYRTAGTNDEIAAIDAHAPTAAIYHSEVRPSPQTIETVRKLILGAVDKLHDAGLLHVKAAQANGGH